jgi:hypothetical protein
MEELLYEKYAPISNFLDRVDNIGLIISYRSLNYFVQLRDLAVYGLNATFGEIQWNRLN